MSTSEFLAKDYVKSPFDSCYRDYLIVSGRKMGKTAIISSSVPVSRTAPDLRCSSVGAER